MRLIPFFFLLTCSYGYAQTSLFNGSFTINEISGSAPNYTINGFFQAEGTYSGVDILPGDRVYFIYGNDCDYIEVDTIYYAYANLVSLGFSDPDTTFTSIPTGKGLMTRLTPNYSYSTPFTADVSDFLRKCVGGKLVSELDQIEGTTSLYADSIFLDTAGLTNISDTVLQGAIEQIDTALNNIQTQVDALPSGDGVTNQWTYWSGTNTLSTTNQLTRTATGLEILDGNYLRLGGFTTATLPTPSTRMMVWNSTLGGLHWYNGTRWAYAAESTAPTFTNKSVLFANSNGQITDDANFNWQSGRLGIGQLGTGNVFVEGGNLAITGSNNTASGYRALFSNTTGSSNTASGYQALRNNTTGSLNTASGYEALRNNTTGSSNTASGYLALFRNTTGSNNTASGREALFSNTAGSLNTASGYRALFSNTTGSNNTASGYQALFSNTTGSLNTASGYEALRNNTTGSNNTASGREALFFNTTGDNNTASGRDAGRYIKDGNNLTLSNNSVFMGYDTRASKDTSNNEIVIGFQAIGVGDNTARIGNDDITKLSVGNYTFNVDQDTTGKDGYVQTFNASTGEIELQEASASYTGFTPAADSGSGSNVASGGTITFSGGFGVNTSVSGTTVTVEADTSELATQYDLQTTWLKPSLESSNVTINSDSRDLILQASSATTTKAENTIDRNSIDIYNSHFVRGTLGLTRVTLTASDTSATEKAEIYASHKYGDNTKNSVFYVKQDIDEAILRLTSYDNNGDANNLNGVIALEYTNPNTTSNEKAESGRLILSRRTGSNDLSASAAVDGSTFGQILFSNNVLSSPSSSNFDHAARIYAVAEGSQSTDWKGEVRIATTETGKASIDRVSVEPDGDIEFNDYGDGSRVVANSSITTIPVFVSGGGIRETRLDSLLQGRIAVFTNTGVDTLPYKSGDFNFISTWSSAFNDFSTSVLEATTDSTFTIKETGVYTFILEGGVYDAAWSSARRFESNIDNVSGAFTGTTTAKPSMSGADEFSPTGYGNTFTVKVTSVPCEVGIRMGTNAVSQNIVLTSHSLTIKKEY